MSDNFDEMFAQYAKQKEADVKSARSANSFQSNYEERKWTGLEQGIPSVIRIQGGPPDSNATPYTARTVTIAKIMGDDGKMFKVVRPSFKDDPNYILNKIIQRVRTVKWVNNTKTFPVQEKYPDIYNIVEKNGLSPEDKRYKFDKGWIGKDVLIMNVIDRAKMDWHRDNKHTMLLAKSVAVSDDGTEWPDEGISSFVAGPKFTKLFKYYGNWEKYDVAIKRTGDMSNAYEIENASKIPQAAEDREQFVSFEASLTEEEKSWEKYNLVEIYKPTSPIKLYNRLKDTIKRIDVALGTDYLTELRELSEKEKARLDAEAEAKEASETTVTPVKTEEVPKVSRARESVIPPAGPIGTELPYYTSINENLKSKIKSCKRGTWNNSGVIVEHYDIEWDYDPVSIMPCPKCNTDAPEEQTVCPCCGTVFA